MYEDKDFDSIMEDKLAKVRELYGGKLDTRKGSVIYTTLAPDSVEEYMMYVALDRVLKETFANTATREWLIKRCNDRGITPKPATQAIGIGEFTKSDGTPFDFEVVTDDLVFTCDKYAWNVSTKIESGKYYMVCQTYGEAPNTYLGKLVPSKNISDLATADLIEISVYGEEEEETEALRTRYFESFTNIAYGFNIAEYKQVVGDMQGVSGVRVYRASLLDDDNNIVGGHGGHVVILIQDSEYGVPTQTLIDTVQTALDPIQNTGEGIGLAPIDHEVHVRGVVNKIVNIETDITFKAGITFEDCKSFIEEAVNNYLATLNKEWENTPNIIVRISFIESAILALTDYVEDITATKINGAAENLTLDRTEVAKLGAVVAV